MTWEDWKEFVLLFVSAVNIVIAIANFLLWKSNKEIEARLQETVARHNYLYERVVWAIETIYGDLVDAQYKLTELLYPNQVNSRAPAVVLPECQTAMLSLRTTFRRSRILLPKAIADQVDQIEKQMASLWNVVVPELLANGELEQGDWVQSWDTLKTLLGDTESALEARLSEILEKGSLSK